jgi:hypothetical protein
MKAQRTKVPAFRIMRGIAIGLGLSGLLCLGLFTAQLLSPQAASANPWVLIGVGAILLLIGLVGPVRVIRNGTLIPLEIRKTILVQAIVLPSLGLVLLICGIVNSSATAMLANLLSGLLLIASALLGFYPLSQSLPRNFYIDEMLAIMKSAGLAGAKTDSPADREFMRWTDGVRSGVLVGEQAPDGEVVDLHGRTKLLSSLFPQDSSTLLVLNFGSYTCPHYRKRIDEIKALQSRWAERGVQFLTVYTAEAHPEDGWRLEHQYEHDDEFTTDADFCFYYAKTIEERSAMAQWLMAKKQFQMPLVLDSMENSLLKAYNTWPIRLYVMRDRQIVYAGAQGPFGYDPRDADLALARLSGRPPEA